MHYPIPLSPEEDPDPARPKQTIERMRAEIDFFRSSTGFNKSVTGSEVPSGFGRSNDSFFTMPDPAVKALKDENDTLRQQIDELERTMGGSTSEF